MDNKILEIGEIKSILSSRALSKVLQTRKEYLQKKVNEFVRGQEWTKAYGELCKFDDIDQMMEILKMRLEELQKSE